VTYGLLIGASRHPGVTLNSSVSAITPFQTIM